MKRRWLSVALFAAIFGAVWAGISLNNYLDIHKSGMVEGSFCSISQYVNCDAVEVSSYASFSDIPIAGLGLIYYVLILIFVSVARFSKGFRKPTVAFVWWSSCLAVLFSVYLSYVSIAVLHALCLTCIGMYIANLTLFISLYLAMRIPLSETPSFLWGYWWTAISRRKRGIDFLPKLGTHLVISFVILGIGMVYLASATASIERPSEEDVADYTNRFYRQSKYDIQFDKDNTPLWGREGAPVTIVEFSDYRCPFCRISALMIKPFLAEYKDNVAYYYVNYPLDSTCNHYMQHQMHPGACLGAKAGICANKVGKFWAFHDDMFKSTGQITPELVERLAKKLDMGGETFTECLNSPETERILKDDIEAARRIYITGTPSIFINERILRHWRSPDILRSVVKGEIERAKETKK